MGYAKPSKTSASPTYCTENGIRPKGGALGLALPSGAIGA